MHMGMSQSPVFDFGKLGSFSQITIVNHENHHGILWNESILVCDFQLTHLQTFAEMIFLK